MLKKTITFEDLDGQQLTEDFYFNISKAELATMELSEPGGMKARLERVIEQAESNPKAVIETFTEIIKISYGIRSEDGKRFVKSTEISDAFMQTDAYSELFTQLVTDAGAAASFMNGIMPGVLQAAAAAGGVPANVRQPQDYQPKRQLPTYNDIALPDPEESTNVFDEGVIDKANELGVEVHDHRKPTEADLANMSAEELRAYIAQSGK